jgi:hypothetical protein
VTDRDETSGYHEYDLVIDRDDTPAAIINMT